ncbi:hypothetical protein Glove_63g104 [Diversispora epigaea]|uniref:Uncharacterized protein n=1 Tax=Diversispora epigaea TaxID=1348612 RepID=A0A397JDN7_9GLOM|nr:hypothetical protein Glove_63g104 [Diversispora epigaea]
MLIQIYLKIEYLNFTGIMVFQNNFFIITIIRSSSNLKHFNISHNDIGNEVVEAVTNTYYELEYFKLGEYEFIIKLSICNIICSCFKFQHFELGFCDIFDITIKEITCLCFNLKYLDLNSCENISKKVFDTSNSYTSDLNSDTSNSDSNTSDEIAVFSNYISILLNLIDPEQNNIFNNLILKIS